MINKKESKKKSTVARVTDHAIEKSKESENTTASLWTNKKKSKVIIFDPYTKGKNK